MIQNGTLSRVRLMPGILACLGVAVVGFSARPATAAGSTDPVLAWNAQTMKTIQATATDPFQASRALALESIAVLDTIRSIASAPGYLVRLPGPPDMDPAVAVAAASHAMLCHLFPAQQPELDAALDASLASAPEGAARDQAVAFGNAVADAVYARRENDGWDHRPPADSKTAADPSPGHWRPTPPGLLPAQDPQWGALTPFALSRPSQFRPSGPPALDSVAFREAAAAVAAVGGAGSTERTTEQTAIARYWGDPAGPAGLWNAIAADAVTPAGLSLEAEAQVFAELNVAIADAAIAAADAKYNYRFWRPITVIREGDAAAPADPSWSPLLETPNYPGYISLSASVGGAAATVLTAVLGEHAFHFAPAGANRNFANFQQAADEAAVSSEYGGIDYSFDDVDGLATGRAVGAWTVASFSRFGVDRGPVIVMDHPVSGHRHGPFSGYAVDNFSPVKTVTIRVDEGERFNVAVDDKGHFKLPRLHPGRFGQMQAVLVATSATGRAAMAKLELDAPGSVVTAPLSVNEVAPAH